MSGVLKLTTSRWRSFRPEKVARLWRLHGSEQSKSLSGLIEFHRCVDPWMPNLPSRYGQFALAVLGRVAAKFEIAL